MEEPSKTQQPPDIPPSLPSLEKRTVKMVLVELWEPIREWFGELVNLQEGLDREGTIVSIRSGKGMRGARAWLLMCSIMIASLGLDLNSPAIIIGAMLISPLMSPILGIGLAVGINDRQALIISLQHFTVAIAIALITSSLYFLITPFGQLTEEIQARTAPTLLDSLVAIFGGLAGIISASRKDASNALPGVAIATALMPPLCVSGYGLANQNWSVMLNAFYLFFLNSFFIAVATFIIVRSLKFPYKTHVDQKDSRRTRWIILATSLILVLPSAYILFDLLDYQRDKAKAEAFIDEYFGKGSPTRCIQYSLIETDTAQQLILELLGESIPEDSLGPYYAGLEKYGLENTALNLIQDRDLGLDQIEKMRLELTSLGEIAQTLEKVEKAKTTQEREIEAMQMRLDSLMRDTIAFRQIGEEARTIFPKLNNFGYAKIQKTDFKTYERGLPLFFIQWDKTKSKYERTADEKKLYQFLKLRTGLDTLQILAY